MSRIALIRGSVAVAVLALACTASLAAAADDPWNAGANWLTVRAGFAKSTVDNSGQGGAGYAFGFRRMLSPVKVLRWRMFKGYSLGAFFQHDAVTHFGEAVEIEMPMTVELVRHYRWKTALRPYLGVGGGAFYQKTYRTGDDVAAMNTGGYVTLGADAPIASNRMLGVDFRLARVSTEYDRPNPVFGTGNPKANHWSFKLGYTMAY